MRELLLGACVLAIFASRLSCSSGRFEEQQAERRRRSTLLEIKEIKSGKSNALHDPAPSLIDEIQADAACAENIESLYLSDFGADIGDPRYGAIRDLPRLKSVYFYCTPNTDAFLSNIAGMSPLEVIETELADLSDTGMKHVEEFPNLKKLVLYGGAPSVGNAGLAEIEGHKSLESLELINTSVTDDGLVALAKLPKLKSVVLYWEAFRGERLTPDGFKHLENLSQLDSLELSGGWAPEDAVEVLRSQLPNCKIGTERVY